MRKLIAITTLGLALSFSSFSFAFDYMDLYTKPVVDARTEITGEVTQINIGGHTLMVEDKSGKNHLVRFTGKKQLEGLKAGEMVHIKMENGKAVSIQKG